MSSKSVANRTSPRKNTNISSGNATGKEEQKLRKLEGRGRHRSFVLFAWLVLGHLLVFGKLFYVQIIEGERWKKVAVEECLKMDRTPAPRGRILDRQGQVLAENELAVNLYVDPNKWTKTEQQQVRNLYESASVSLKSIQESRELITQINKKAKVGKLTAQQSLQQSLQSEATLAKANLQWDQAEAKLLALSKQLVTLAPLRHLKELIPDAPLERLLIRNLRLTKDSQWWQVSVAFRVPFEVGERVIAAQIKGVGRVPTTRRVYPQGELASHVLGTIGDDGRGRMGIESKFDREMAGEMGIVAAEFVEYPRKKDKKDKKDKKENIKSKPEIVRYRIPGTECINEPMVPGGDIKLTLDATIQHYTEEALKEVFEREQADSAVAVVLSPKSGEILAVANYPTFSQQEVTRYYQNAAIYGRVPDFPGLINRAVAVPYEPGSTLKSITIAAALEEKKVNLEDYRFDCVGKEAIGTDIIHCALHHPFESGHGSITLTGVLQHSCNLATADCAFQLGKETLYDYEQRFGLTLAPQSGMPGESRGQLSAPSSWSKLKLANVGFGQGISATALQVAAAYGVLANGGTYQHPHIVQEIQTTTKDSKLENRKEQKTLRYARYGRNNWKVISPEVSAQVLKMLQMAVDHGTGVKAQLSDYTVGGKTGTAQIAEGGHYKGKYVASFAGITPISKPELVILVAVTGPKHGHYGGEVAAPVFKKIAGQSLPYLGIVPDKNKNKKEKQDETGNTQKTVTSFAE